MSKKTKIFVIVGMICFAALIIGLLVGVVLQKPSEDSEISYNQFLKMVEKEKVEEITLNYSSDTMKILDQEEKEYIVPNPRYEDFKKDMLEKGIEVSEVSIPDFSAYIIVIFYGFFIFIMFRMIRSQGLQNDIEIKKTDRGENAITFDKVAGLSEVKKDMITFVDFLKNKKAYTKMGAKLPRGIILYGPPGTGKTLLAKAVAGEANVPFFYANGSDFIEKYVGVGASRVRQLFEKAKKSAPCIIFIDELDSVGSSRDMTYGNSEQRQTINALLSELDGFNNENGVLVIGATNRIEDLDKALIRPGRFDSHIAVPIPETPKERLSIIQMYSKDKKFAEDVDFDILSKETLGFSPADLEALMNDAALISVQKDKKFIDRSCIDAAIYKKLMKGHQKEDKERDQEEIALVAWHEAGHAIIGCCFGEDIPKVTIVPSTSGAGGVTFFNRKKLGLYSIEELERQVMINYGGRCAELLLLHDPKKVTTGASSDIRNATEIIHQMVTQYGMNEDFGLLNLSDLQIDNRIILDRVVDTSKRLEKQTQELLEQHFDALREVAETLIENETITGTELMEIFEKKGI